MADTDTTCPHCEGALLVKHVLVNTGENYLTCPECDATWVEGAALTVPNFRYWDDFVHDRGLTHQDVSISD